MKFRTMLASAAMAGLFIVNSGPLAGEPPAEKGTAACPGIPGALPAGSENRGAVPGQSKRSSRAEEGKGAETRRDFSDCSLGALPPAPESEDED